MIIINLATIDFGGGGGSSKPLTTESLIANVWSRGRRIFSPANYNVDGFSDVTINTAIIGENSALDFSAIGWDGEYSDNVNSKYNADIQYSKEILDKWNNGGFGTGGDLRDDTKLVYCPLIDTSNKTNFNYFFYNCNNLQIIPAINSSNSTNMNGMFYNCKMLQTISQLDTSNVTDMSYMFYFCNKLKTIPAIDTSKVTNMQTMFSTCESLESLPPLNTENVTNMNSTFYNCYKLKIIPPLDTSKVTSMEDMFGNCESITTIPAINTSKVTDMEGMFSGCNKLKTIPAIDTSKNTNMKDMFSGCSSLISLPLFNVPNVTKINTFFGYVGTIKSLTDLGGFKDLKIDWNDGLGLNCLPNLTYQSVMNVLNNLYDFRANGDDTTTRTLKLNTNSYNLLTTDDIALAINKGWNITT